jgi:hypothetical protein
VVVLVEQAREVVVGVFESGDQVAVFREHRFSFLRRVARGVPYPSPL